MTKLKKEMTAGSSSKEKLAINKALLPEKYQEKPSGTATEEKKTVLPEKPQVISQEKFSEIIEATGLARSLFCGGFDFILIRTHKSRLTEEEKTSLSSPLDKIEVKLLKMLPEAISKHAETASPIVELFIAASLIMNSRKPEKYQEKPSGTATEEKKTVLPEKPQVNSQEKEVINAGDLPANLKPVIIEDQKPTP